MKPISSVNVLITARAGSKRIPNKNINDMCGIPLIAWTIMAAKNSKFVNDVYVSTDSSDIAKLSETYGALVPRLRPSHLATDTANSVDTVLDFSEYLDFSNRNEVLLLQPTSPLRQAKHIDQFMEVVRKKSLEQFFSVRDITKILKLANIKKDEIYSSFIPNGAMYFSKISTLRDQKTFFSNGSETFLMSDFCSIDIDTQDDWNIAEACLSYLIDKSLISTNN